MKSTLEWHSVENSYPPFFTRVLVLHQIIYNNGEKFYYIEVGTLDSEVVGTTQEYSNVYWCLEGPGKYSLKIIRTIGSATVPSDESNRIHKVLKWAHLPKIEDN